MNIGNLILNTSLAVGLSTVILLLLEQFKKGNFERQVKWLVRIFATLLTADFLLLIYYFYTTNLRFDYVYSYSSSELPLIYKLAGTLAGAQGTYLYWSTLIVLGALWLSEKGGTASDFMKKTQIIVLTLGTYFTGMTLFDSPFKTIYEVTPNLAPDFIPTEGAGLHPLLHDIWMAIHPPIIFIAYAAITIPFALAVVYLFKSIKKETEKTHQEWIKNGVYWCRISWLFLTLAIAIGGFWSYKVLGWGGFWGWDPVETSSLVPWLLLTAALHALSEHKLKKEKYSILAPVLVGLTFTLVVYATIVTRSAFFNSIHAFGKRAVSSYLLPLIVITIILTIVPAVIKYLKTKDREENEEDKTGLGSKIPETKDRLGIVNKTNIFYITIMLLSILTVISFWGVTYPALRMLFQNESYGVFPSWYNIFSYIFFIPLMLMAGLCLNYKKKEKEKVVLDFIFFSVLTFVAMFIKPIAGWNIVDYSSVIGPEKPFLMVLIGSISLLSFIPPSIYIIYSLFGRWKLYISPLKRRDFKIKELGVLAIHLGIVFILMGAVVSTMFSSQYEVKFNLDIKDQVIPIEGTDFTVKLIDFQELAEYSEVSMAKDQESVGITISELHQALSNEPDEYEFVVLGKVKEVRQVQVYTYALLTDGRSDLWIAMSKMEEISEGMDLTASGELMFNFLSPSLGKNFEIILLASFVQPIGGQGKLLVQSTQQIEVAVYQGTKKIAQGWAKVSEYRGTTVGRIMIARGITRDVYIIYNGSEEDKFPITIKFVPLINLLWFGVILFAAGIILILFSRPTGFAGLKETIVFRGLCSGCGTCAAICPENAISVEELPVLVGECTNCGYCLYLCPRSFFDPEAIEREVHGELSTDTLGEVETKVGARVKDKKSRKGAQDGGFVTALLTYAFENGIIDGAIVTGLADDWRPMPLLVTSVEGLKETAGSKYTNSSILSQLQDAKKGGLKKLAVVGLSCQIEGLRKIQHYPIDSIGFDDMFEFTVALFCKGNFLYDGLMEELIRNKYSVDLEKIKKIDIKGKEILVTSDEGVMKIPLDEAEKHKREGCTSCSDFTSRISDFSVGSVGSAKGFTTVLARTKMASEILKKMQADNLIEISTELDEDAIERLQVAKKRRSKEKF